MRLGETSAASFPNFCQSFSQDRAWHFSVLPPTLHFTFVPQTSAWSFNQGTFQRIARIWSGLRLRWTPLDAQTFSMSHYAADYPTSTLGESIIPDNDYLPKSEDFVQALKLSDGEMGFYPTNATSGFSTGSYGEQFGFPQVPMAFARGSPMASNFSGHSSNSGANLMLMQKIESLQNQVYVRAQTHAPSHLHTTFSFSLPPPSFPLIPSADHCITLFPD